MEIPSVADHIAGSSAAADVGSAALAVSEDANSQLYGILSTSPSFAEVIDRQPLAGATFVQPGQRLELAPAWPSTVPENRRTVSSIQLGPGVVRVQSARGQSLRARVYGYLYMAAGSDDSVQVGIRSPIEISFGDLNADFLCLPCSEASHTPSSMDIQHILATHGICCGIDPSACARIGAAMADPTAGARILTVARGRLPQPGQDARVFRADGATGPPSPLLEPVWPTGMSVDRGNVLAVLETAIPAAPGYTIAGDRLIAREGQDVPLTAGDHVEVELLHGNRYLYRATAEGFVVFWDHSVEVVPLSPT